MKCEVWSVKQAVRSEKCEVGSVKCDFFQILAACKHQSLANAIFAFWHRDPVLKARFV